MIGNNVLDIMMHQRFIGHQSYALLCTETTLSNHPEAIPKSSCDVHLLRSRLFGTLEISLTICIAYRQHPFWYIQEDRVSP